MEHQFGDGMLVSAGYNGSFGRHVMVTYNVNQARLFDPNNPLSLAQRRPYPFFADILLQSNSANSAYNAMYLSFRKRYGHGLDLTANYTWSKSLDLFSSDSGGWQSQNALCRRCDRALSDFNRASYFSLGYIWEVPFGPGRKFASQGIGGQLLGHWQFSGITQYLSGTPGSVGLPTYWPNVANVYTRARPNRICNGNIGDRTMDRYFDTSCFVPPLINTFGNAGRNIIIGPGAQLWDMSIARDFPIAERFRLDFRADFFSAFNHQNWNGPDLGVLDAAFGKIFGKSGPRRIQFGLKLSF